jgi:hypothetical protein
LHGVGILPKPNERAEELPDPLIPPGPEAS